jgi:Fe2+ transport system protein FeoA
MGLTPGVEVVVLRKALLNGPIEVIVRGTNLALGYGVAKRIFIKRLS